jgi:hypothetical protein
MSRAGRTWRERGRGLEGNNAERGRGDDRGGAGFHAGGKPKAKRVAGRGQWGSAGGGEMRGIARVGGTYHRPFSNCSFTAISGARLLRNMLMERFLAQIVEKTGGRGLRVLSGGYE